MQAQVTENAAQKRFELPIAGDAIAAAYYRLYGETVVLIHTEVPQEFSGQGIATQLAYGTLDLLRKTGRKVAPRCPFMSRFIARHQEYADLVAP